MTIVTGMVINFSYLIYELNEYHIGLRRLEKIPERQ